jgi:hypothetical protein
VEKTNLKQIIPPNDVILESTWFGCQALVGYNKVASWGTHVLLTNNGVAYMHPDYSQKGHPTVMKYNRWGEGYSIQSLGKFGMSMSIQGITFKPVRNEAIETKDQFEARCKYYVATFRPILIHKKIEWIEANRATADKKMKKHIRASEKMVNKMVGQEQKRLAKGP